MLFADKLTSEILAPVPHRHWTFSIPRVLRGLVERDRKLLGLLSQTAYAAILKTFQTLFGRTDVRPRAVSSPCKPMAPMERTFIRTSTPWFPTACSQRKDYHPYVFRKHKEAAIEIHVRLGLAAEGERYTCLFYRPAPLGIVIFVTKFLSLHMVLACALIAWLGGWTVAVGMAAILAGLIAMYHAWPDLRDYGLPLGCACTALRYAADLALFLGAFLGGLRQRMLYLSATID